MLKAITALTTVGVIALAAAAVPTRTEANPVLLIPAVIVGGVAVAASTANARAHYARSRTIYVNPDVAARCQIARERTSAGWRKVKVCG
jgi:hypothetical protein